MYMKYCKNCGLMKTIDQFHKNKAKKDGLQNNCAPCMVEIVVGYRATNRENKNIKVGKYKRKKDEIQFIN